MKRILLTILLAVSLSTFAQAQTAVGVLRCIFNGSLETHESRQSGSPVVARLACGAPFLLIDADLGYPHIRLQDGKEG